MHASLMRHTAALHCSPLPSFPHRDGCEGPARAEYDNLICEVEAAFDESGEEDSSGSGDSRTFDISQMDPASRADYQDR